MMLETNAVNLKEKRDDERECAILKTRKGKVEKLQHKNALKASQNSGNALTKAMGKHE